MHPRSPARRWTFPNAISLLGQRSIGQLLLRGLAFFLAVPSLLLCAEDAPFELVLKQGLPPFEIQKAIYSPDEHYAALSDGMQIVIYDLVQAQELRRVALHSPGLGVAPLPGAFAHKSHTLYVRDGPYLFKCDLENSSDCSPLQSDIGGPFIVSQNDLIAYTSVTNKTVLLDPNGNRILKSMMNTIPKTDEDDFSWSQITLYEEQDQPVKLALLGEIDRENKTQTTEEWHLSLFDLDRGTVPTAYGQLPLSVDTSAFDSQGNLFVCGISNKDSGTTKPPIAVYSTATHDFLQVTSVKVHLPRPIQACMDPDVSDKFLSVTTPPDASADSAYRFGTLSPKKDLVLYTQYNSAHQTLLYLGHPGTKKPPELLAGSAGLTTGIEFVSGYPAILVHGVGSQFWDLTNGNVKASLWDSRLSPDRKVAAVFVPDTNRDKTIGADLWLQGNTSSKPIQTSLHLSKMPSWYGVSATGEAVVYEIPPTTITSDDGSARTLSDGKMQAFYNGETKVVPCNWSHGRDPKPSVDASGSVFSAVCGRNTQNSSETGTTPFLVRWELPSLQELEPIEVQSSLTCANLSPDHLFALLCYRHKLQLVNLASKVVTEIPVTQSFQESIENGQVQQDDRMVVLAVDDGNDAKVKWVNTADNSIKTSIPLGLISSFSTDGTGRVAALSNDGIVSLLDRSGVRQARLVPVASQEWLVFSDTGFLDGTANAFKWASYRSSPSSPLVPVSMLFNELYTPGLLPLLVAGQVPHFPDGLSLTTLLELPGTQLLLQSGGATPTLLNGKAVVCFSRTDVFDALIGRFGQSSILVQNDQAQPGCQNRIELSDQSNPESTVKALHAIGNKRFVTPWDGQKLPSIGTVHLLTVAVGEYRQINEPSIPTAVPAVEHLANLIKTRYPGEKLVDWDGQCGGALQNAAATKSAILRCLDKMIPTVNPDDMVVLVFAGHGGTSAAGAGQGDLFYFYPSDARTSGDGLDNVISSAELADEVRNLKARRLVVIMDACDSGAVMPPLEGALAAKLREAVALAGQSSNGAEPSQSNAQGVLLIAASEGVEESIASGTANPFFDRLEDALTTKDGQSAFAHEIAGEMSVPLMLDQPHGPSIATTPVAIQIGADFALTSSTKPN